MGDPAQLARGSIGDSPGLTVLTRKGLSDRSLPVSEALKFPPGPYDHPRVSRDGKRLAYETNVGQGLRLSMWHRL